MYMDNAILLVDDNLMHLEIQTEFLVHSNVEVLIAYDGQEALAIIETKRPNLIFMDLHMPKMEGAACCRAIKSNSALASIPVVMVTPKGKEQDKELCYSAGCDHFLSKPLDRDAFLYVARKFIPDIERREKRILVNIEALLRVKNENVPCKLYDLSVGGVFIITDYFVTLNSLVQISFTLPDGTVIECHGRFVRINRINAKYPHGIGIKFAMMPQGMQESLNKFIDSYQ